MRRRDKALIFLNGDEKDLSYAKKYIDGKTLLIGCDGGTDKIIRLGLKPDAAIGDFDSIKKLPKQIKDLTQEKYEDEIQLNGTTYIRYPNDKDFLDVELAIDFAKREKVKKIILVNASGNQLDHVLGTMIILGRPKYRELDIKIITQTQKIYIAKEKTTISGSTGDKISLIPLYGPVDVKSSSGLKYDPAKYNMSLSRNIGISNKLTNKKATLQISKGRFLVIQHL